ncbi:beta-1,4-galactosyltransferase 1 isoform X1 [Ictalurus furcatus]|uniref:beta-1,4-galactosyltransferase 1 isoform X1 n=1 Tax=Ictalurus furcatus TaxID=66913 RepID=UPI00235067A8|nr:beta-1,4-galactosyltransferase 1 isoform X1 [Ictalurus furcatus]XP_053475410.1 beta-1,4-galactosyltransferase 1 isoform X1 [Ictalurus furcatus]
MREFPRCLLNRRCTLLVVVCLLAVMFFYMLHFDTSRVKTLPFTRYRELTSVPVTSARNDSVPSARNDSVPTVDTQSNQLQQYCPETPPKLDGPLYVDFSEPVKLDSLLKDSRLSLGGRFMPSECVSQQRVALIIPFRDRELHLKIWLFYMHPILQRQQIDYGIYIIEQDGEETFNRAKLLNVGYVESLKEYDYNCFVFSDVDLIPTDDRNLYKCYDQPRHLSVAMDKFGFKLPYNQYFGGVSALSKEQYLKINGFPNNYWGWGGEDDDVFNRLTLQGMSISRPDHNIGRCKMIRHARDKLNQPNPHRFSRIARTKQTMETDGINSLNYNVVGWEKTRLYTKIIVDIGKPPSL